MRIIAACTLLLCFQLAGEAIARGFQLSLPGPVLGMALLVAFLAWRGLQGQGGESLRQVSTGILGNLSLLFVPAVVGVMLHFHRLKSDWFPIVVALVISTIIGLAVTAWVVQRLASPAELAEVAESDDSGGAKHD